VLGILQPAVGNPDSNAREWDWRSNERTRPGRFAVEADATRARAAARQHMSFYVTHLPNYRNNLKALGWQDADFGNGCSDRLVDAIVAWGTEDKIRDRIQAHFRAGATHVCIQPLRSDNQPLPDLRAVQAFAPGGG
jgi:alkanesulfonate monooxygenase SsuD/methylene tetrahydromethanopterin reductase-like flavin-dependent oxidoreductase (luciferase family)